MSVKITYNTLKIKLLCHFLMVWSAATCQQFANSLQNSAAGTVEFLVQLAPNTTADDLRLKLTAREAVRMVQIDTLSLGWRMYKITMHSGGSDKMQIMEKIRRFAGVVHVQYNNKAEYRSLPNDPEWPLQTNLQQIDAPYAWRYTTGGITPQGDSIVVAVLEKGLLRTHPDLAPNLWRNYAEIPNNKVDDDGNGYTDDYLGWDARQQGDGPGDGASHGTSVCGIIGARGNNKFGIAGVNWAVKMMTITNVSLEDEIIAAHYYAYNARKLYNQTGGKRGAFVVAVNVSFGFDQRFPKDHPLWCAVYDSLAMVGVLSCGATNNRNLNIDLVGDIPTNCPSTGLIGITGVGLKDEWQNRGYGAKSIDLAAPGTAYTAVNGSRSNGSYGNFSGTSAATPHVSGAIALLYSLPCPDLTKDALTAPAACAARMRNLILDNVAPNPLLSGLTVTGGRLDIKRSIEAVVQNCGNDVSGPVDILQMVPNPVSDQLEATLQFPNKTPGVVVACNILGQIVHTETISPVPFGYTRTMIDVSQWPAGCYVLSFAAGGVLRSKKFIKH